MKAYLKERYAAESNVQPYLKLSRRKRGDEANNAAVCALGQISRGSTPRLQKEDSNHTGIFRQRLVQR